MLTNLTVVKHFAIYMYQIITQSTLNLYNVKYQLYLKKVGGIKEMTRSKNKMYCWPLITTFNFSTDQNILKGKKYYIFQ